MSAMMPIVKKVEGLIALAGADGPEGLTAGKLACKIIREKGLRLVAELPREEPTSEPPWRAQRKPDYRTSAAPKPRTIVSQYDGTCRDCGTDIRIGDRIVWVKGKGAWHPECAP